MLLKISLLKYIFLLNLSTIQCFNVIMMKNLNENQLVNRLSEFANQEKYDSAAHKNVNSISIKSQRKRNPHDHHSDTSSEEVEKKENNDSKNDQVEVETDKSDFNEPISNSTIEKHSNNKHEEDTINTENSSKTVDSTPMKRNTQRNIKKTKKHKKNNHKNKVETSEDDAKPNIGRTIKTIWNTLRSWFRRNNGSGNEKVMSLIDDQNLKDVMKRIIIIMRASDNSGKRPKNQEWLDTHILRNERSGEDNDPFAPGKLPVNLIYEYDMFPTTITPKKMKFKPNPFWNYWTYPKELVTENYCKGEGLILHGNLCLDSLGH